MREQIIALTTIPQRFTTLGTVLESLLAQRADRIVLALPPRWERYTSISEVPRLPEGVDILSCEDIGPACKILPVRAAYSTADITYCDDDCLYGSGWFEALRAVSSIAAASTFDVARLKRRGGVVAQGFAGVRVPAEVPLPDYIPTSLRKADDLWLSAHFEKAGMMPAHVPVARAAVTPLDLVGGLQTQNRAEIYRAATEEIWHRLGVWPPL